MTRAIASLLAGCLLLCSCDPGELVSQDDVRMTVVDRKSGGRRFWVSLQDEKTGQIWKKIRFSGKWCSNGPTSLPVGSSVTVLVKTYREKDTGRRIERIDSADLDRQFC